MGSYHWQSQELRSGYFLSTETTFGGRGDLAGQGTGAIMSYGDLIFTTLTRARTAREAIEVMDQLCQVRLKPPPDRAPRLSLTPLAETHHRKRCPCILSGDAFADLWLREQRRVLWRGRLYRSLALGAHRKGQIRQGCCLGGVASTRGLRYGHGKPGAHTHVQPGMPVQGSQAIGAAMVGVGPP